MENAVERAEEAPRLRLVWCERKQRLEEEAARREAGLCRVEEAARGWVRWNEWREKKIDYLGGW